MAKVNWVSLTQEQRLELGKLASTGRDSARKIIRARILLKASVGESDPEIAKALDVGTATVERVRRRFVAGGPDAAVEGKPQPLRPQKRRLDGDGEAKLVMLACSTPPDGHEHWTLDLLADRMVKLSDVPALSGDTVGRVLKKNELKPWLKDEWCIPPHASGEFVWHMEDVLEVYRRPYDPQRPVVAMDEKPVQLLSHTREPIPCEPGQPAREDHEYKRNGTANIFCAVEPLGNWRQLLVTERRTKLDFAAFVKELVDERYSDALKVVLVMDNLNTHSPASLYDAFPPEEARRITDKLEIHHTPKHGSWLNVAEIELSVVGRRLRDRVNNASKLARHLAAIEQDRNEAAKGVDWQFTTNEARIKLKRLYPSFEMR